MTKKLVFAGFMGAILMSAGANAATTIATQGYVDAQVGAVQTVVNTKVTMDQVNSAIQAIDHAPYQLKAAMRNALDQVPPEERSATYPTVGAVLTAIEALDLGLTSDQIADLQELFKNGDIATTIAGLSESVTTLEGGVEVPGSVDQKIDTALADYTKTTELPTYQEKSTEDLMVGTTDGQFRAMTPAEKAALASGIDSELVAQIDTNTAAIATKADKTTVDGLNTTVAGNTESISNLQTTVAGKADASALGNYYTKTETDDTFATKGALSDYYTTEAATAALAGKADASTVTALSETVAGKADATALNSYYTIDAANGNFATKGELATTDANVATNAQNITGNANAIAANDAKLGNSITAENTVEMQLAGKITMPAECLSDNAFCVLSVDKENKTPMLVSVTADTVAQQ